MTDLVINENGDLTIRQTTQTVSDSGREVLATFDLETTEDTLAIAIRRAIETPLGYIEVPSLKKGSIEFIDSNYGSLIHSELSEGISLNLLSRIKSHIVNSLRTVDLLVSIADLQISVVDTYTIQLYITYTDNTTPTTLIVEV